MLSLLFGSPLGAPKSWALLTKGLSISQLKTEDVRHVCAGLVYRAMGFPPQFFTVLFAVPRVTGYLSHWREQLTDPDVKIARPQQNYTVCLCLSTIAWKILCSGLQAL